ncbi:MAG: hypothetical protein RDU83_06250 [bacterium]|nr:hypothetical protein [bacterium]
MAEMDRRRYASTRPRGPDGRFLPTHGAYAGRRLLRAPDKRRSVVKQAAALRDFIAHCLGYVNGWGEMPEPQRGLVELAAEVRVFRRLLASPLWRREEPPGRYVNVSELERRILAGLAAAPAPAGPDVARMLAEMRAEEERRR